MAKQTINNLETLSAVRTKLNANFTDLYDNKLDKTGDGSQLTGLTKTQVNLSNVDNTSDLNKPISTATQNALNGKLDTNGNGSQLTNLSKTQVGLSNVENKTTHPYHGIVSRSTVAPLPTNITTTTFTLSSGTTNIAYYNQGVYFNVTSDKSTTLVDGVGLYWIYFSDVNGTLSNSKNFPGTNGTNVLVAGVYWNGSNYGVVWDERHGYSRDTEWHNWAHSTIGARYGSGLDFSFTGTTNVNTTFSVSSGSIFDEDINYTIPTTTQARIWYQTSASTYTFVNTLSILPYYAVNNVAGAGIYAVNSANYQLVSTNQSGRFFNYFVYGTTTNLSQIHIFVETTATTGGYTSVANARTVPPPSLSGLGLSPEFKLLYRVVVNGAGLVQTLTTSDDYRTTSSVSGGSIPSSTASSVSFVPTGDIAATTVQTALVELDNEKALKTVYNQIADKTVTNTLLSTSMLASAPTFAANLLNVVGRTVRLKLSGTFTIPSGGDNATLTVLYNGTTVNSLLETFDSNVSNVYYEKEITMIVRSIGVTGQVSTTGRSVTGTGAVIPFTRQLTTIDTTSGGVFDLKIQFGKTASSITSEMATIEILN